MKNTLFVFVYFLCFCSFGETFFVDRVSQADYVARYYGFDRNLPNSPLLVFDSRGGGSYEVKSTIPFDLSVLPDPEYADRIMSLPAKYVKKEGNLLVELSEEEKASVDAAEAAAIAEAEATRQASKPLERKAYENQFFDLIEQLYNATGVTNQVTPKLGFPEIQSLIETVQATDPMGAVNYSLKLLSIDAALKRYDVLWWDDAIEHTLPEE